MASSSMEYCAFLVTVELHAVYPRNVSGYLSRNKASSIVRRDAAMLLIHF